MTWLGEWINAKTLPKDPVRRERVYRRWAFVIGPIAVVVWLALHFIG
jgi:hypothetical protein